MTNNQKILRAYLQNDEVSNESFKRTAERLGVDRRSISYLNSIRSMCTKEMFEVVKSAIEDDSYITTAQGERTKSLEILAKLLNNGDTVSCGSSDGMVVYLLNSNGIVKIGIAKSITGRLCAMQTGNPYQIELIAQYKVDNEIIARNKERALHKKFNHKHFRGEWFILDKEDLAAIDIFMQEQEATNIIVDDSNRVRWDPDAHIKTELGKAWYYELLSRNEPLSVEVAMSLAELANYKYKIEIKDE